MNTNDGDVERFLKLFTLLDFDKIEEIVQKHNEKPELRYGQQQLAAYVIETIFGITASNQAQKISEILFGKENKMDILRAMDEKDLEALMEEM
jgi:tyrosyl-tRNA synthetase